MHDNERAVDASLHGPSMLAGLMSVAAAYAVQRGVPLERVAEAAGLGPGPGRTPQRQGEHDDAEANPTRRRGRPHHVYGRLGMACRGQSSML